ncbi:S41 family peptidase [Candidatus Parcubacteria bacterium]|nr:S41 family peptidase [Candidatus Parcubacteria bacterium]
MRLQDDMNGPSHDQDQEEMGLTLYQSKLPLLGIGLAILLASASFFSGLQLGSGMSMQASVSSLFYGEKNTPPEDVDLTEFWQVWHSLDKKFVSSHADALPTDEQRIEGAIRGLVSSYSDPYTVFFPPEESSAFQEDISGNFSGVGMEVGMRESIITVIAPLPDSPAEKAGIRSGDQVIRIDDTSTEGMTVDEAVKLIRGEKGTTVNLTVVRKDSSEVVAISVVRDTIVVPTIDTEVHGDTFVIKLYSFNALAEAEMQQALRTYVGSGTHKIVLDLRGNPGGYLQSAVEIASYFLPAGQVVVRESYGESYKEDVYRSSGKTLGSYAPQKMVVLVDGGSASASEILAGALQEHGVATLIGEQTFGKGSVQELIDIGTKSSLKVTIARWLTPDGVSISDKGLSPDTTVTRTPEQYLAGEDPQMDAALKFLQ